MHHKNNIVSLNFQIKYQTKQQILLIPLILIYTHQMIKIDKQQQIFVRYLNNRMSYITFGPNDIVYIKGIGYATLVNCGSRNSLSQKIQSLPQKKQSIIFDPDLFNSDGDSNHSKKSQSKSEDEKPQKKTVEAIGEQSVEQESVDKKVERVQQKTADEPINIIQAKLQGSNHVIYTSQKNVTKSITIVVKSMLINHRQKVNIDIQINRNIDTLKKMIFQQIGQSMNNYSNVKLFATVPTMAELNVTSKTIIQCQIKDMAKIVLVADYAFGFRPLNQYNKSKYKVKLANNVTITSSKVVEEAKKTDDKAVSAQPAPSVQNKQAKEEKKDQQKKEESKAETKGAPKVEEKAEEKAETATKDKKQEQKKIQLPDKLPDKKQSEQQKPDESPYSAKCAIQFSSGRRYWQIKIQKLPSDEEDLVIGVCVDSDSKQAETNCWGCDYAWGYQVIAGKKVSYERDWDSQLFQEESEAYGYAIRQNETIGVLAIFKGRKVQLSFYKNTVSCGQAFTIDMGSIKSSRKELIPFVTIGGEAQVTLDSKAAQPLDSYRSR